LGIGKSFDHGKVMQMTLALFHPPIVRSSRWRFFKVIEAEDVSQTNFCAKEEK
jgi:hypothetical protein